jgi:hypothetical protein
MDSPISSATSCRGPFSVFRINTKDETPPILETKMTIFESEPFLDPEIQDCAFENAMNDTALDTFEFPTWTSNSSDYDIMFSTPASPHSLLNVDPPKLETLSAPNSMFSPSTSGDFTSCFDYSLSNASSPHIMESRSPSLVDSNVFNRSFKRPFMTPEVRYLLSHYMNHVVDIMTVVSNLKSPWRSLHLPRALQGCGELEAVGTTCNARYSSLQSYVLRFI